MTTMKSRRPEPAEIEFKNMRFLIMDRPTDSTMDKFIEVCLFEIFLFDKYN
jgi:hypothetical protein